MSHRMMRRALVGAAATTLAVPVAASAHVTVQPRELPVGGFARMDVRVPNERDKADSTKVVVKIPPGFYNLNYEPKDGWKITVKKKKLDKPVEQFGEKVTEQVSQVTIASEDKKKGIAPGEFLDFGLSGGPVPGKAGESLSFPALQTYSNGEVVRWIAKDPEAESPAAQIKLLPGEEEAGGSDPNAASRTGTQATDEGDFASKGLGIAALVVGGLGLLIGLAAFAASRRRPAA